MHKGKYTSSDKMSDLICDNYSLLMVMSRFGIALGFGDKTVGEVCEMQNVDCNTFLAVSNFISNGECRYDESDFDFSLVAMMDYLKMPTLISSISVCHLFERNLLSQLTVPVQTILPFLFCASSTTTLTRYVATWSMKTHTYSPMSTNC